MSTYKKINYEQTYKPTLGIFQFLEDTLHSSLWFPLFWTDKIP